MSDFQSRHAGQTIDDAVDVALSLSKGSGPASLETAAIPFDGYEAAFVSVTSGDTAIDGVDGFDLAAFIVEISEGNNEFSVVLRDTDGIYPVFAFTAGLGQPVEIDTPFPGATGEYRLVSFGGTRASGLASRADGSGTIASGNMSYAGGLHSLAAGDFSRVSGVGSEAIHYGAYVDGTGGRSRAVGTRTFGSGKTFGQNAGARCQVWEFIMTGQTGGALLGDSSGEIAVTEGGAVRVTGQLMASFGSPMGFISSGQFSFRAQRLVGGGVVVGGVTVSWDGGAAPCTLTPTGTADGVTLALAETGGNGTRYVAADVRVFEAYTDF